MEYNRSLESRVIDYIRFPLAVFVVIHHCFGDAIAKSHQSIAELSLYDQFRCALSHVLVHIDNPVFFFISGYLFFLGGVFRDKHVNWNFALYKAKLKKRFETLLIPYILWNIIPFLFLLSAKIVRGIHEPSVIKDFIKTNFNYHLFWDFQKMLSEDVGLLGLSFVTYTPINGPLWFMRDLIMMVLLSPLVYYLITKTKGYVILLFAFLYLGNVWYPLFGLSIAAVFFFSLGAYFSIYQKTFLISNTTKKHLLYYSAFILLLLAIYYDGMNTTYGSYIYPFYVLIAVLSSFNLASNLVERDFYVSYISGQKKHCFFLYAGHLGLSLVFIFSSLYSKLICDDQRGDLLLILRYFLVILTVCCTCIFLDNLSKRFLPRLHSLLTGNR